MLNEYKFDDLAGLPTNFFEEHLQMKTDHVSRLINCISQATKRIKQFNSDIHELKNEPFNLGKAQEAIDSLTNPQDNKYFSDILYFVSDATSPLIAERSKK